MAIAIRLSRGGAKKRPYYRIIVADSRSARDGKYLEQLGTYNPLLAKDDEKRVVLNADRAKHWLSVGAQPSDRVARFLDAAGVLERTARNNPKKAEPGEKAKERVEERAAKVTAAEEAKQAAEEEAKAAAAAPAEEVAAEEAPSEEAAADANEAVAEAVADEVPADATADEAAAIAEEVSEGGPVAEEAPAEAPAEEAPAADAAEEKAEG